MKIQAQKIYQSKILKKVLSNAAQNSALFGASVSLALSLAARPIAISLAPKTDVENKKYAIAKSISSSAVGFLLTLIATKPLEKAIKNIDNNPKEFLKDSAIDFFKNGEKTLLESKKYHFATQLFKLGLGFFLALPKSYLTSSLINPFMKKVFKRDEKGEAKETPTYSKYNTYNLPFKNSKLSYEISNKIGGALDSKPVRKLSDKFYNTNFEQHMFNIQDIFTTSLFIFKTMKDKNIEDKRKKVLSVNSALSTGLSVLGGLTIDKLIQKPLNSFIENFKEANKDSKELGKYLEGIRVAKTTLILGGIYYILIPLISTFLAERVENKIGEKVGEKAAKNPELDAKI